MPDELIKMCTALNLAHALFKMFTSLRVCPRSILLRPVSPWREYTMNYFNYEK